MTDTMNRPGNQEEPNDITCVVHPTAYDDECEMCAKEVNTIADFYARTCHTNDQKRQKLGVYGGGLHPVSELEAKLDLLIELVFGPEGQKQRLKFETKYQVGVGEVLDQAIMEISKARLDTNPSKGFTVIGKK